MQIFRHLTANDVQLQAFPFKSELSMEAYLVENEGVLSLDSDTFSNVEIIETDLALEQGRKSNERDGRIDILATYSQEYIAIIELKLGQLKKSHLKQLEDYLTTGKDQILNQYPDILDEDLISSPKWIGILIGSSIEAELASQLVNGYLTTSGIQIAALTIQRFRSKEGNVYVTTDTYFGRKASLYDTSKYMFNGVKLAKNRLVLEVIKQHITRNPDISYSELEKIFPKSCHGTVRVFDTVEIAYKKYSTSGRKRHFLKPQELIKLSDCTIAVSTEWTITSISKFIKRAKEIGFSIIVNKEWHYSKNFEIKDVKQRGWTFAVLKLVEKQQPDFTLQDIYKYETELQSQFPDNNNVKAKIRQQLQILRDKGYITFVKDGLYQRR